MSLERLLAREIGDGSGRNWERLVYPIWLAFGREEGHLWEFFPALFESELVNEPRARIEGAFVASAIGDHARAAALLPLSTRPRSPRDLYDQAGLLALLSRVVDLRAEAFDPLPGDHGVWLAHPIAAWAASPGNGAALAAILDGHPWDADHAYVVARKPVWSGNEDLSAWLRHGVFEHRSRTRLGRLAELENLRLFAVALGDDEAAADLGAMVDRHRRALLRREILVPLAILEEISMLTR
jgi:hypothetical protein